MMSKMPPAIAALGPRYNCENGGPAPEKLTNKMLEWTAKITELKSCSTLQIDGRRSMLA